VARVFASAVRLTRTASLALVALLFTASVTGCGDDDSGSGRNYLGGEDGGVCNKDRDELAQLLAQPQACATSETCPTGSHCGETGQCDWQCIADSDCGSGFVCTCDGVCVLEGSGGTDAGVPADPSCPRDRDLLVDGTLQQACTVNADCPGSSHCNTGTGHCQLDTPPLQRACTLDEECPLGAYCNGGTGRCAYDCLATNDPILPCASPQVCDCRGRCVAPDNGQSDCGGAIPTPPSNVPDSTRIVMTIDRDLIEVPVAPWTSPSQQFTITLRSQSAPAPAEYPTVMLRAPTGVLIDNLQTLLVTTWSFQPEGNGYVAHRTVNVVGPSLMPTILPGPWPISITGAGLTGLPRSVLINLKPPATTTAEGIYSGTLNAKSGGLEGLASVPVTAWVSANFILFFDEHRALSPTGIFGIHRSTLPSFTMGKWLVGTDGGNINAAFVTSVVPAQQENGDLRNGELSTYLVLGQTFEKVDFDFNLYRRGALTQTTCTTDANCGTSEHCEEEVGRCAPGADWRAEDWGTPLVSGLADQWVNASSWFLDNNTPELFGMPAIPGSFGLGRIMQCLPQSLTWTLSSLSGHNAKAGFEYEIGGYSLPSDVQSPYQQSASGELLSTRGRKTAINAEDPTAPFNFCMQPVPLGLNRDHATLSAFATLIPNLASLPSKLAGNELLDACLDEAFAQPPAVAASQETNAARWFGTKSYCLSPARLFPMIEWNLRYQWERGNTIAGVEARAVHAVVSRWLDALGFVGNQATEQLVHDRTSFLEPSTSSTSNIDRALKLYESAFAYLFNARTLEAFFTIPRDVIRHPDYRLLRPVAYYTFDSEDMNGTHVLDLTGKTRATLNSTSYSRPTTTCQEGWLQCSDGIVTNQPMTIPQGPAALYGDFQAAFSFQVPTLAVGQEVSLLEYGDTYDLLYQIVVTKISAGDVKIAIRHGARTSPLHVFGSSSSLTEGQPAYLYVARVANYKTVGGTTTWESEYTAVYKQAGVSVLASLTSTEPLVTSLMLGVAHGTFNITGYANELALWDSMSNPFAWGLNGATDFRVRARDNYLLDAWSPVLPNPAAVTNPNHDQSVGLAPVLLETIASYLSATAAATKNSAGPSYAGCVSGTADAGVREQAIARAGQALRYSWVAETVASHLRTVAAVRTCGLDEDCRVGETCIDDPNEVGELLVCAVAGTPVSESVPWQDRYDRARGEVDAARAALMRELTPVVACEDPFGIAPSAVPLYFGDPVGTTGKFFAASDYLLNTWALPAVARAETSLLQAQEAWLSKRTSEIQQLQTEQQHQARLEQIEVGYGQEIIDLCGFTNVDPLQVLDTPLNAETCFRVSSSFCNSAEGRASAQCYRGEMGKAVLTILSAEQAVEVARKSAEASENRFDNQEKYCAQMQLFYGEDASALDKHNGRMASLRRKRVIAGAVSSIVSGIATGDLFGAAGGIAGALSANYDRQMADEEALFNAAALARQNIQKTFSCYHDADQIKYGLDTDYAVIEQRLIDVELALLQLQNYKARVLQLEAAAHAALEREQLRTVPSVAHHYWLETKIDRYERDFVWAQRLTMLAVRAVEYEFQQSIPASVRALSARSVDELQQVLSEVQQEHASRTINGRRPEESSMVLSLRDDVLKLSNHDLGVIVSGERNWSSETRFGKRLQEQLFAVYDDDGAYLGQGIPFTLRETGVLKYRCAERLWRVNATIQGDIPGMSTPSVPVMLLKRNTFASQWCDGHGGGTSKQQGTVFPSANLFKLLGGSTNADEADASTAALLMPWFNVIRSEFYKEQYVEGSSEELAGRGLYGDYVLLFPESGLLEWTDANSCNDFPLSRVEDVLLRFDLISVDDL
jgi:hypothetical protein